MWRVCRVLTIHSVLNFQLQFPKFDSTLCCFYFWMQHESGFSCAVSSIYSSSSLYPSAQWRGLPRAAAKPEQTHHTRFHLPRPTVVRKLPANRPPPITPLFIPPASFSLPWLPCLYVQFSLLSPFSFFLDFFPSILIPVHFPFCLSLFHSAFLVFLLLHSSVMSSIILPDFVLTTSTVFFLSNKLRPVCPPIAFSNSVASFLKTFYSLHSFSGPPLFFFLSSQENFTRPNLWSWKCSGAWRSQVWTPLNISNQISLKNMKTLS